ncbi:MAG: type II toxin-antitoxin system VapC family toxin [Candidatus Limnocylindrales bacterium]
MTAISYLDASAMVKLVLDEIESPAMLRWHIESEQVVSSRVGLIETRRATSRRMHDPAQLDIVLRSVVAIELDDVIARGAAQIRPAELRTLDAIHLATALSLGPGLVSFVTYDDRLADAARAVGLPVVRPA